jgi:NCS1 family nucleobase:cation symporter-1
MGGIGALALVTTGASLVHYGVPIWDPVLLSALVVSSAPLAYLTIILLLLGVIVVNIYADTIGPGYDFSNIYPKRISWFMGVVIVVVIAAVLQAWSYYASAQTYVENWLLTYGAILGGVEGIITFDYAVIRRFKFEIYDLFYSKGRFRYFHGINPAAVIAFAVSMVLVFPPSTYINPNAALLYPGQDWVFQNAWVSAILISGLIYLVLMAGWVIPVYQPDLKGSLASGYIADDTATTFGVARTASVPDTAKLQQKDNT